MYSKYIVVLLLLSISLFTSEVKCKRKDLNSPKDDGLINIDSPQDQAEASGAGGDDEDGYYNYDDEDEGSGHGGVSDDEDDVEGSGPDSSQRDCLRLREQLQKSGLYGAYMPHCTSSGEFEIIQCHGHDGYCWCVDHDGREIQDTRVRAPRRPNCDHIIREKLLNNNKGGQNAQNPVVDKPHPEVDNGIVYNPTPEQEPEQPVDPEHVGKDEDVKEGDEGVLIQTVKPADRGPEDENPKEEPGASSIASLLMGQPGILAGVIGGAVVGLLCAVLLVMFIVYRMRKKDEGSYALDEPKTWSPSHQYQRASNREFYA